MTKTNTTTEENHESFLDEILLVNALGDAIREVSEAIEPTIEDVMEEIKAALIERDLAYFQLWLAVGKIARATGDAKYEAILNGTADYFNAVAEGLLEAGAITEDN